MEVEHKCFMPATTTNENGICVAFQCHVATLEENDSHKGIKIRVLLNRDVVLRKTDRERERERESNNNTYVEWHTT